MAVTGFQEAVLRRLAGGRTPEGGTCVPEAAGELFRGMTEEAVAALAAGRLRFHSGRIGGAVPMAGE